MKKSIAFILFSIILLTGCKKQVEPNYFIYTFTPASLEYLLLDPGKNYVYKDSATGDTFSVMVGESILDTVSYNINTGGSWIIYGPQIRHSQSIALRLWAIDSSRTDWWFSGSAIAADPSPLSSGQTDAIQKLSEGYMTGVVHNIKYPITRIPGMTIESRNYTDVLETVAVKDVPVSDPTYNKSTIYWARGIGIIKRRVITTGGAVKTYTLLRIS